MSNSASANPDSCNPDSCNHDSCNHDSCNLLGAAAVAAIDAIAAASTAVVGHGGETAAALVAIGHHEGLSNDSLRRVLGLSHPGAVRLVDRLVAAGLIERRPGADRRAIALHITTAGDAVRTEVLARRQEALATLLAPLNDAERQQFGNLLAKMLRRMPRNALHGLSICRLCDHDRCSNCPIDEGIAMRLNALTACSVEEIKFEA